MKSINLMTVIVNFGLGSKVLKLAKEKGVTGGTIVVGKGSLNSELLYKFGITETKREIVMMVAEDNVAKDAMSYIESKLRLKDNKKGIGFISPINYFYSSKNKENSIKEVGSIMYKCIYVVVDKGMGEAVIESANKAGSRGGTIISGRGSGIHETKKLFKMEIEPEKDVVMILAEDDIFDNITNAIKKDIEVDKPGKGIMFAGDVEKAYGMNVKKEEEGN